MHTNTFIALNKQMKNFNNNNKNKKKKTKLFFHLIDNHKWVILMSNLICTTFEREREVI